MKPKIFLKNPYKVEKGHVCLGILFHGFRFKIKIIKLPHTIFWNDERLVDVVQKEYEVKLSGKYTACIYFPKFMTGAQINLIPIYTGNYEVISYEINT